MRDLSLFFDISFIITPSFLFVNRTEKSLYRFLYSFYFFVYPNQKGGVAMADTIARGIFQCSRPISILGAAAIVGKKEGEGPMAAWFDRICPDSYFGQKTWEQAEGALQKETVSLAIEKAGLQPEQIDGILAGDLVNQCTSSSYGLRGLALPFLGIYGACSTMAEGLLLATLLAESGAGHCFAAATSSHFSTAERQFRFPLSYGSQRTPTAQWTCTASGALLVSATPQAHAPVVTGGCIGCIVDLGVTDANHMGAAADTYLRWFQATGTKPNDYDAIITGDLGIIGSELFCDLLMKQGYDAVPVHHDCGAMMFDPETQDTHAGGSGCGCSGSILCGYFLRQLQQQRLRRILFAATGALLSPMLIQQGESIPCICHLVALSAT
jgi:stage V sporulation protein AD